MGCAFWLAVSLKVFVQTALQKKACHERLLIGIPCGVLAICVDVFTLHELPIVVYISAESLPIALCLVYEQLFVPRRPEFPTLVPLLNAWLAGFLLLATASYSIFMAVDPRVDVEKWWQQDGLVVALVLVQCANYAISHTCQFNETQHYVHVPESPEPVVREISIWDKKAQLARILRIGFASTITSTAAQGFLRWLRWSLKQDVFQFNTSALLFAALGCLSLPYLASCKREAFRSDFYFGMLAMSQLFSLSCVSVLNGVFIQQYQWYDFLLPTGIVATILGAVLVE